MIHRVELNDYERDRLVVALDWYITEWNTRRAATDSEIWRTIAQAKIDGARALSGKLRAR